MDARQGPGPGSAVTVGACTPPPLAYHIYPPPRSTPLSYLPIPHMYLLLVVCLPTIYLLVSIYQIWSVCSFEGQSVDLTALSPLAHLTGGALHRFILGGYPKDERARLADALTRSLTQQWAFRGIMKMRTSSSMQVVGEASGALRYGHLMT